MSPTVLRSGPYRFFFYSGDGSEPVHVHVGRDDKTAKFWLNPVRLERNDGFSKSETRTIEGLVRDHEMELTKAWHEYFKSGK